MTGAGGDANPDAPREPHLIRVDPGRLTEFEAWATEGTARAVAARVLDPAGRIALVKNGWSEGWTLPGGGVEPGEEPAAAAAREVREETALAATVGERLVVLDQLYVSSADVPADASAGEVPEEAVAYRGECHVFAATADGAIPPVAELGVSGETIRAARWFETVPEDLHDGAVVRPYL
ncbi:hypothetical protein GCM10027435_27790 [Haloparvum alkalitolerans]|uniref:NUDIX domain-containing protein n=1 Tax=Haloparvum alkalitolerans TaxID=1042953 RepID=UPI003CF0BCF2